MVLNVPMRLESLRTIRRGKLEDALKAGAMPDQGQYPQEGGHWQPRYLETLWSPRPEALRPHLTMGLPSTIY